MNSTNFERWVGIDWSGAGTNQTRVNLAICDDPGTGPRIVLPAGKSRRWTRDEVYDWLLGVLHPESPRAIVGLDAALGYPVGTALALTGAESWRGLVAELARELDLHGTARAAAHAINDRFKDGGPFRFDDSRNDRRFYLNHDVAYFRQGDLITPQCISAFYMGSGAAVGFHTITALATLSRLMDAREEGLVDFHVWPQEGLKPRAVHVIAETYPALYSPAKTPSSVELNGDEEDAWKIAEWLRNHSTQDIFEIPDLACGRHTNVDLETQLLVEGWILGP